MRRLQTRVLILTRDEALLVVGSHMSRKNISEGGLTLKYGPRLAQLRLGMQWCHFNTQLLNLLVSHTGHAAPSDQQVAVAVKRIH